MFFPNQVHRIPELHPPWKDQSADPRLKAPDRGTEEKVKSSKTLTFSTGLH